MTRPKLSAEHLWNLFRDTYGPFVVALSKLEPDKQKQLAAEVTAIFQDCFSENQVSFEYLVTTGTKR